MHDSLYFKCIKFKCVTLYNVHLLYNQDGRNPGEVLTAEDELARLTQSIYPPAQLLQRPLPDGVDPTHLELYLSQQHFQVSIIFDYFFLLF